MKKAHFITVFGMAILGATILPQAADQPSLSENLQPLAKGLGQWSYQYKDEKGQELTGNLTCTVAAGGKAVVAKDQTVKNGKVLFGSITISYWQPEKKVIASDYFDSTGMHATSFLTKSGDTQVWQGYGYGAKGNFGTAVSTVEYQGNDTFVSQLTHFIADGEVLPDTPKFTLKRVKDTPNQIFKQPPLNKKLKPMAKFLGKWSFEWVGEKGETVKGIQSASVDAGGAVIVFEGNTLDKNGNPINPYFDIFYWMPETKSIGGFDIESSGGRMLATVIPKGDKVFWQAVGYDDKGTFHTGMVINEFQGHDSIVVQITHRIKGGNVEPDTGKFPCKRVKE